MRRTPQALFTVGVLLLLFTFWCLGALATLDELDASHRRAARLAVAGLSEGDLRRVFVAPSQVICNEAWFRSYVGGGASDYLARFVVAQFVVTGSLGASLCAWGVCEGRRRRRPVRV